jgi:hypothetical protein
MSDDEIITYDDTLATFGPEELEAIMRHGRHHHDDDGRPYWLASDLAEAADLVAF